MPSKITDNSQLSLFDRGLNAPPSGGPVRRRRRSAAKYEPEILPASDPRPGPVAATPIPLGARSSDAREPAPFEQASYELYLRSKTETTSLTKSTFVLLVILILIAVLGVQVQEALFGLVKFGSLPRDILVGVLGWATLLSTLFTAQRAAYTAQKERQCGLFYQRVLRFPSDGIAKIGEPVLVTAYVCCLAASILLTLIVARQEMVALLWFIARGILNMIFIGPWETTWR